MSVLKESLDNKVNIRENMKFFVVGIHLQQGQLMLIQNWNLVFYYQELFDAPPEG